MSSDPAIVMEGLGKAYSISHADARSGTLREAIVGRSRHPLQRPTLDTFWALRDLTLEVAQGEVVGIIGGNGAGKSTLLKILSRITEPTEGRALLCGRVGSLLEVGTGFHPELTGRENIYLNGSILGMRRAEIERRFDEIVDFAGISVFLDTPVKRYSSGMYVRLAFAVAAHLEPEILIIDEVLAVGDAEFQQRCLGRMESAAHDEGRTILFVSHNLAAVESLCSRAVYLRGGRVVADGPPEEAIGAYLHPADGDDGVAGSSDLANRENRHASDRRPVVELIEITDDRGHLASSVPIGGDITIRMLMRHLNRLQLPVVGLRLRDHSNAIIASASTRMARVHMPDERTDVEEVSVRLESLTVSPGDYWIDITVKEDATGIAADVVERAAFFTISSTDFYGNGFHATPADGPVCLKQTWRISAAGLAR